LSNENFNLLNEISSIAVLCLIILSIQTNSHVFTIWFIWNLLFLLQFTPSVWYFASIFLGFIGIASLSRTKYKVGGRSPEEFVNFEQLITFSWFNDVLDYGLKNVLDMEHVYELMDVDTSKKNYEAFKEIRTTQDSLIRALFTLVRPCVLAQAGFALISSTLSFAGPFFLNMILKHVENPSSSNQDWAFLLVGGLFLASSTRSIADGQTYFLGRRIGTRVRAALIGELYAKSLRRIQSSSSGDILNLMSVDSTKVLEVSCYLMYVWTTPLQVLICISFLIYVLGWPALTGIGIMVLMIPIGRILGKHVAKRQKILMQSSDKRMISTLELLSGIRLVKFFAWETNFLKQIDNLRGTELVNLWSYIKIIAINKIIWYSTRKSTV
jgi:ABC-type bacteriocin/lantibiotic exporter with double-glycine peptidase domain